MAVFLIQPAQLKGALVVRVILLTQMIQRMVMEGMVVDLVFTAAQRTEEMGGMITQITLTFQGTGMGGMQVILPMIVQIMEEMVVRQTKTTRVVQGMVMGVMPEQARIPLEYQIGEKEEVITATTTVFQIMVMEGMEEKHLNLVPLLMEVTV
jgi:hypothetical protein